jgi:hypothetical protein
MDHQFRCVLGNVATSAITSVANLTVSYGTWVATSTVCTLIRRISSRPQERLEKH